jgi:hypothetical protein
MRPVGQLCMVFYVCVLVYLEASSKARNFCESKPQNLAVITLFGLEISGKLRHQKVGYFGPLYESTTSENLDNTNVRPHYSAHPRLSHCYSYLLTLIIIISLLPLLISLKFGMRISLIIKL